MNLIFIPLFSLKQKDTQMGYRLFLDDERQPPRNTKWNDVQTSGWVIVRNYERFVSTILELGVPMFISFDHDLGEGKTGKDCADWLVNAHLDGIITFPSGFDFQVHSQNPIGGNNIRGVLTQYLSYIGVL